MDAGNPVTKLLHSHPDLGSDPVTKGHDLVNQNLLHPEKVAEDVLPSVRWWPKAAKEGRFTMGEKQITTHLKKGAAATAANRTTKATEHNPIFGKRKFDELASHGRINSEGVDAPPKKKRKK